MDPGPVTCLLAERGKASPEAYIMLAHAQKLRKRCHRRCAHQPHVYGASDGDKVLRPGCNVAQTDKAELGRKLVQVVSGRGVKFFTAGLGGRGVGVPQPEATRHTHKAFWRVPTRQ